MGRESPAPPSSIPRNHTPQEQQDEYRDRIWSDDDVAHLDSVDRPVERRDLARDQLSRQMCASETYQRAQHSLHFVAS